MHPPRHHLPPFTYALHNRLRHRPTTRTSGRLSNPILITLRRAQPQKLHINILPLLDQVRIQALRESEQIRSCASVDVQARGAERGGGAYIQDQGGLVRHERRQEQRGEFRGEAAVQVDAARYAFRAVLLQVDEGIGGDVRNAAHVVHQDGQPERQRRGGEDGLELGEGGGRRGGVCEEGVCFEAPVLGAE